MKQQLPAYPLFIQDPYFSFYSNGELLNDSDVTFWTGCPRKMLGFLKVDGKVYSFLGKSDKEKLEQTNIEISTFKTTYFFKKEDLNYVCFEHDACSFSVYGSLDMDELIKIAAGITKE